MKYMYGAIIFLTGCCSLIYQVIWQKYLHLFVGSEMRSTTIIVAIFLAGLSLGYILFLRCGKVILAVQPYGDVHQANVATNLAPRGAISAPTA